MARRAGERGGRAGRVIAVSRSFAAGLDDRLRTSGVETVACDLLDRRALEGLPEAPNVVLMAGRKFGSRGAEWLTWAMNAYLPGLVMERFPASRIVAFSTGNVYGLSPVAEGGAKETTAPRPVGEYAMSCLGRERLFEYFSRERSIPMAILRLNYACELRYGLLVDLAQRVLAGQPVDLAMGHFNTIWQADANAIALRAFDHVSTPPFVVNLTGPEILGVRQTCEQLSRAGGRSVTFAGVESTTALISNAQLAERLFGPPGFPPDRIMRWIVTWLQRGGPTLNKPTHFESREGIF
jgi:nucleoside-diphosphate-sugar epimerase